MQSVFHLLLVAAINCALLIAQLIETNYEENVKFKVENETECVDGKTSKNLAMVVHGWSESCDKPWARNLIKNLLIHRKGCVVCMDYAEYSKNPYPILRRHFEGITTQLTRKVSHFVRRASFDPDNIYMFGFSFGSQVVIEAGKRFAREYGRKVRQIDVCEPTIHGFSTRQPNFKDAAQNVQCIHTSVAFGTLIRDCHQDWNMGACGMWQVAEIVPLEARAANVGNGSHGLCPLFYNAAFEHRFPATLKPMMCIPGKASRKPTARQIADVSMGYFDALKNEGRFADGQDFYARTYNEYPFNEPIGSVSTINFWKSTGKRMNEFYYGNCN